jgi:prevent-host-death family protein
MARINIHDAKTHLSRLIVRAQKGEEIIIAKAGKPVAKLVRVNSKPKRKAAFGFMKGKIWIAPDFDAPDPEIERLFYDGPIEPLTSDDSSK